jgi:hypothetical protein
MFGLDGLLAPVRTVGWHRLQRLRDDLFICSSVILRGAPTRGSSKSLSFQIGLSDFTLQHLIGRLWRERGSCRFGLQDQSGKPF